MKVIEERIKRDGQSKLTNYCLKSHKSIMDSYKREKKFKLKLVNGVLDPAASAVSLINNVHIPRKEEQQQMQQQQSDNNKIQAQGYCVPLTMVLVKKPVEEKWVQTDRMKREWPGVQEIMTLYHKYACGKCSNNIRIIVELTN